MVIIGLSGTQGCGKTTLLNKLKSDRSEHVDLHQPEILRTLIKQHGITFNDHYYRKPSNIWSVQVTALLTMIQSDIQRLKRSMDPAYADYSFSVSDRSYFDLEAYTCAYLHTQAGYADIVQRYSEFCRLLNKIVYDQVYQMDMPSFGLVQDGVRPTSVVSQRILHSIMTGNRPHYPNVSALEGLHTNAKMAHITKVTSSTTNPLPHKDRLLLVESLYVKIHSEFERFQLGNTLTEEE